MSKSTETKNVDITVSSENLQDDLFKIYSQLFEGFKKEDVKFEELKGGFVNSIYMISPKKDLTKSLVFRTFGMKLDGEKFNQSLKEMQELTLSNSEEDGQKEDGNNNQNQLDINTMFFNRMTEYKVMNEVSKYGLCQKVYAKYNNGICYGYTEGVTLNGPLMLTNDFLNEMATKLARFHSIKYEVEGINFKTHHERMFSQFGPMMQNMARIISEKMYSIKDEYPYNVFPGLDVLFVEEQKIVKVLDKLGFGEITFCHNDVNQKNIIWNVHKLTLGFIDFEMSMSNYSVLEIGQLFYFFTGHFFCDFNIDFFPSKEYRMRFVRKYLEELNKLKGINLNKEQFEEELNLFYHRCSLAALHFMLRITSFCPFFEFQPDLFKNEELTKQRREIKYYCGKFGYENYKGYLDIKDEIMNDAENYLKTMKSDVEEKSNNE